MKQAAVSLHEIMKYYILHAHLLLAVSTVQDDYELITECSGILLRARWWPGAPCDGHAANARGEIGA